MKTLILGAGKYQREPNADHLDIYPFPGINILVDLNARQWDIPSESYDHINATHVIEHLTSLLAFLDECHRILRKGGSLYCISPAAGRNDLLEFSDPTHKRCFNKWSIINYATPQGIQQFGYTDKAWAILDINDEITEGPNKDCLVFLITPLK